jgi:glycosyltransferase involved in cell wall biosynthesis
MTKPDLTIGFPVYNGGAMLSRALGSLLAQTYRDFVLHISDNASTDNTPAICRTFAAQDGRIIYTRQPRNIGVVKNFRFLLQEAKTPFFMWAAHDDWWHPTFVEKNILELKQDPLAIASISRIGNCLKGKQVSVSLGTYPLPGSADENMRAFWRNPQDVARLYAVYRTKIIRKSFPDIPWIHAFDYVVAALTLQFGTYIEVPETLMWREGPDRDRYLKVIDRQPLLFRVLPGLPLTYYMLRYCHPRYYRMLMRPLVGLNLRTHRWYTSNRFPSAVIALNRVMPWLYPDNWVKLAQQIRSAEERDSKEHKM